MYFLSTSHVASTVKRSDGPNKVDVSCPPLLEDYIKFMRGVDCGDITLYNAGRRSKKWWQRILFHMIEVCLLNGYALEGCVKPRSRGHKKRDLSFRIEEAEMLIGAYRGRKRAGRKRKRDEDRLEPTLQHLPVYGNSLGDSVVCTKKGGNLGFQERFSAIVATFSAAIAMFTCASPQTAIVSTSITPMWSIGAKLHAC